jgi:hypothetical protein
MFTQAQIDTNFPAIRAYVDLVCDNAVLDGGELAIDLDQEGTEPCITVYYNGDVITEGVPEEGDNLFNCCKQLVDEAVEDLVDAAVGSDEDDYEEQEASFNLQSLIDHIEQLDDAEPDNLDLDRLTIDELAEEALRSSLEDIIEGNYAVSPALLQQLAAMAHRD